MVENFERNTRREEAHKEGFKVYSNANILREQEKLKKHLLEIYKGV